MPAERTNQILTFKIIDIDYAGPLICKTKEGKETNVYILLFTCSLTRAIHIELLSNQSTQEFIMVLKQLIAGGGRASVIYSDITKTFVAASKWISKINRAEKMQEYLIKEQIKWKFNLSTTPWGRGGGRIQRMVGLVK